MKTLTKIVTRIYQGEAFEVDALIAEAFDCRELTDEDRAFFSWDDQQDQIKSERKQK